MAEIGYGVGQVDPRLAAASAEAAVATAQERRNTTMYRFPNDLGDIFMQLDFYEYNYAAAQGRNPAAQGNLITSIALPMPTSLLDSSRLEVGGKQLGVLGSIGADIAGGGANLAAIAGKIGSMGSGIAGVGEELGSAVASGNFAGMLDVVGSSLKGIGDASLYLLRAGVGAIAPQLEQGIGAALGTAVNPHATLIFDGVDLKIHNFEWQFAPKSPTEQATLDAIIQKIQYHIHPDYASPLGSGSSGLTSVDRGLLTYPALIEVKLIGVSGNMAIMFKPRKLMMCNQFNVDFTPTGNVELNRGGTPVMTRCSMNLTESVIHTRKDYSSAIPASTGGASEQQAAEGAAPGDTVEGTQAARPTVSGVPPEGVYDDAILRAARAGAIDEGTGAQ